MSKTKEDLEEEVWALKWVIGLAVFVLIVVTVMFFISNAPEGEGDLNERLDKFVYRQHGVINWVDNRLSEIPPPDRRAFMSERAEAGECEIYRVVGTTSMPSRMHITITHTTNSRDAAVSWLKYIEDGRAENTYGVELGFIGCLGG